jgi:polysaccharide export outer membrane protein
VRVHVAPALLLSLLAAGAASADEPSTTAPVHVAGAPTPASGTVETTEWRTGDVLEVRVLSRADLSCTVRVLADGSIDVPFAGRYRVQGRTLAEVKADVTAGFGQQERQPQVAITVASLSPDEFYVLGEVAKTGVFAVPRTKRVTFLQAIGMAGGFGPEADFTQVKIVGADGADPRTVDASPARLVGLAKVVLRNGDTIVVPSVGRVYLMGQVNRTGGFAPPPGERLTLTKAIALGGGFTRLADTKNVLVTWRNERGESQTAAFNVAAMLNGGTEDVPIFPGNLIHVPERLF